MALEAVCRIDGLHLNNSSRRNDYECVDYAMMIDVKNSGRGKVIQFCVCVFCLNITHDLDLDYFSFSFF